MSATNLPLLAGMVSTTLFVVSYLPMLTKAFCTRDLGSYSLGNLVLANVGNGVHSVYVFSLPAGPIWILHTFYLVSTVIMLVWHRRYSVPAGVRRPDSAHISRRLSIDPLPAPHDSRQGRSSAPGECVRGFQESHVRESVRRPQTCPTSRRAPHVRRVVRRGTRVLHRTLHMPQIACAAASRTCS